MTPGRNLRKLNEHRCQCSGCGKYFKTQGSFEMHRTGQFGKDRRCMTDPEMVEAGMVRSSDDWWGQVMPEDALSRIQPVPNQRTQGVG